MKSTKTTKQARQSRLIYYVAAVGLLIVIFFLQPKLVGGQRPMACSRHGYLNKTDGLCNCINGFYGSECQFRYCPFGKSWMSPPQEDHVRYQPLVPCSNMGICDPWTGTCSCREGFDGRACERLACPSGCSGHGVCRSLREAGNLFDGLHYVRPPVSYDNWDADKIMGCICDSGWDGYDCSQKTCPMGKDPLDTTSTTDEYYLLQCKASSGYFTIQAFGGYTEPIPYDADPAYLKHALEQINDAGEVLVTMSAASGGIGSVCSSSTILTTTIQFVDHVGQSPPIKVLTSTADTRMWPSGSTALALTSSTPTLRMVTRYLLTCPACSNCGGSIYFTYRNSISSAISVTSTSAKTLIASAITSLSDLTDEGWTSISVEVTGTNNAICTSSSSTLTINIYSDFGNIPYLNILDSSYTSSTSYTAANITFTSNKGNAKLYPCSNQGYCDRTTGQCTCLNLVTSGSQSYRAVSSDGSGSRGTRGDCGYIIKSISNCTLDGVDACSGHGFCDTTTTSCRCNNGWSGLTCEIASCPKGRAFFDEPLTSDTAHGLVECSGNGICDRTTGLCYCRSGFMGSACQILDCPRSYSDGSPCSGNGQCLSTFDYYLMHGYSYGDVTNFNTNFDYEYYYGSEKPYRVSTTSPTLLEATLTYPATWDAHNIYTCACQAKVSAGFEGSVYKPLTGPRGTISGYDARGMPLPGYSGYDCSQRNCPKGDTLGFRMRESSDDGTVLGQGNFEIQRIVCTHTTSSSFGFRLKIFDRYTPYIFADQGITELRNAIETLHSVGLVRVTYANASVYALDTVCNPLYDADFGGILVEFRTELGDLDLMTSDDTGGHVTITEYQQGTKTNLECGGVYGGYCDRSTGLCVCNPGFGSSNYAGSAGSRGDCGYKLESGESGAWASVDVTASGIFEPIVFD